jgi:L-arabinose isomerase
VGRSIVPNVAEQEVWFLTGSQTMYGEEVLAQVATQSQQVVAMLDGSDHIACRVVWKPVLTSRDAILQLIREANVAPNVVGIITWMHTFSPAKMWIAGLCALDKPMLHFHTQANTELPWATIDFDFMNLNQAAHGDREFGYIETRLGIARTTVVGHASDPTVTLRIGDWCRGAAGWLAARNMSVARFGDNMRYVAVTEGDKTEAEAIFGSQINTWGVMDLASLVDSASSKQIDALIEEYLDVYDVVPSLVPGADRHESLRYGAAIEVGLRQFLEEGGFTAFTTSFEDLGTLRQLPGLAVQRLMADGYGFGAEGDWKTAMLVRIAAVMGAGRPGGASLMEDYTYHMVPGQELSLGAHMLEVSPSLSSERARLDIAPLSIGGKDDPVRLVFTADPGPAVVLALSDMRDRFRLVAAEVECVPLPAAMPCLPVGHAIWRSKPDFRTAATAWLAAGASHHTAMSNQITTRVVQDFALMTGVELLVIDDSTTIESAERELRLNSATFG